MPSLLNVKKLNTFVHLDPSSSVMLVPRQDANQSSEIGDIQYPNGSSKKRLFRTPKVTMSARLQIFEDQFHCNVNSVWIKK